jgi:signal transduction histidine kinase
MRNNTVEKRIMVSTTSDSESVIVRVIDSGPNILKEHKDKVFDPFFTTKSDSTGIGLSICHRIISDHNGTIAIQTSRWGGAEFCFKIPLAA